MYVDGKKYACDACVRGHRVSGCNHNDRPLQEIAKKGRPVSQCQHCRSLRKSRSSHVKCDCGEKTKGAPKHHYINENGKLVELDESKEGSHCQCPHGGRCTCSVKKEYLECVPETTTSTPGSTASTSSDAPRAKPRLQSTQSESSLTRFTNGHHKAVRHHAHGTAPYHIPAHHHHPAPSDNCHEKITDVDLSSRHGHIIMPSDPEDVPAVFPRSGLSRQIKSENGSPSVASSGYQDGGETALPPSLTRNISDFNLPGSRGVFELSVRTTDLPAFDTFDTPDYSAHDFFVSAVDSEAGFPFSTNYNPPNSATWPYEGNHVENFCEVPPGLTRSVSGDDSEVENNWAYPTLPSPAHNITPGYLNGPFSAESSDFYESDHHDGLSTVSSRVGLANIGTLPTADLRSMESYLNTAFDSSNFNLGVQDERNSQLFADSEVLMMVPVTSQNVPMPPDFETR